MRDNWYAIFVLTGKELKVQKRLQYMFNKDESIELYPVVPLRQLRERRRGKWKIVQRKMFPGYVLLFGEFCDSAYRIIKKTPDVVKVLKDQETVYKIPYNQIRLVDRIFRYNNGLAEISEAKKVGDKIEVLAGPLKGFEGIIDSVNVRKGRARIKVEFAGDIRYVDLGIDII